ncbi:hypothetical protein HWV00_21040 (plasmid) [Moritella sp. 24]|uniref:hypothetical protein n=1 Tax=Moritella sp. 24 TaxID=2746230 RepID=UPI001BABC5A1|nr:hypothetical protein [Moritella sp. 24]QUM78761.1 hypothetical protein HWV00_21040 [Moritella sp. 24]
MMQKVQDRLDFQIETPSDAELARRFAERQAASTVKPTSISKHKQRCKKNAKKLARLNR